MQFNNYCNANLLFAGICLTTDIDTLLFHMNNTRYLREVDFARADFYVRTRLWSEIKQKGGSVAQICTNIRYRRFIRPFTFYTITTKVNQSFKHFVKVFIKLKTSVQFCVGVIICKKLKIWVNEKKSGVKKIQNCGKISI